MNTIRVIINSDKIPSKLFHVDATTNLYQLNNFIKSKLIMKSSKFNKYLSKLACCFIKIDYEKQWLLLKFNFINNIGVKLTDTIDKFANDGTLICILEEVSEYEYDSFENRYINDCKPTPQGLTDINLYDSIEKDSDDESVEACFFGADSAVFKSTPHRYYGWGIKKKTVKSHYYSWN